MTAWGFGAVGLAFGCAWVAGRGPRAIPARLALSTLVPADQRFPNPSRAHLIAFGVAIVALAVLVVSIVGGGGLSAVLVVLAVAAAAASVRSLVLAWRGRLRARQRQLDVIELCDSLAAELRAGLPAGRALENACDPWPEWAPVATAARLGGDVAAAFRHCSDAAGAAGLDVIAASWEIAAHTGAALAVVLDRMADGLRSDEEARAEVTAALGAPRATAKMLAVLPAFGLLLGTSMGARPVDFLLHTDAGRGCLAAGVALALAGLFWVERLASAAERS